MMPNWLGCRNATKRYADWQQYLVSFINIIYIVEY